MKFGKDLSTSMVPEWESQYCNYNQLKEVSDLISSDSANARMNP
jgi:SPX domain protein involved in polyphosphate accumulation